MIDIDKILIRCSSIHKIMTNGKDKKNMGEGAKTYLRQLYREHKYGREKEFTSKYTEKGLREEQNAITLLSYHLNKYLEKNDLRLSNEFITGEPDAYIGKSVKEAQEGYDTKCPYDIFTFPWADDKLDSEYEWQAHGYMALTGAKKWTVSYCLVNSPASQILEEKKKLYYKMGCPDDTDLTYHQKKIDIEKAHIYDMPQFKKENPHFDVDCFEWVYDIPADERVLLFPVERDEEKIERIYQRVKEAREYMKTLHKN